MYEANLEVKRMEILRLLHIAFCNNIDLLSNLVKESPKFRWLRIHFSTQDVESSMQRDSSIHKFSNIFRQNLCELQVLELINCNFLASTSCEYLNMKSLRQLTLLDCKNLENFLNGIDHITTLEELYMYRCDRFQKIPYQLSKLTCLKVLSISQCHILYTTFLFD